MRTVKTLALNEAEYKIKEALGISELHVEFEWKCNHGGDGVGPYEVVLTYNQDES